MRLSPSLVLALLPALAVAEQQQAPLMDRLKGAMGWLNKATAKAAEYVPSSIPSAKSPTDAGAAKVAEYTVPKLTVNNWKNVLKPSPDAPKGEPEQWMVFLTGGNKTCNGMCRNVTREWNKAVTVLAPLPDRPKLAYLDCERWPLLCNQWNAGPPLVYHMFIPQPLPDQSQPATTVRRMRLNRVNTTSTDIAEIHTKKKWENIPVYEGYFHPFDGLMQQFGLASPYAYVIYAFSVMPSWLPMIAVSFISRNLMGRRGASPVVRPQAQGGAAAPAGQ